MYMSFLAWFDKISYTFSGPRNFYPNFTILSKQVHDTQNDNVNKHETGSHHMTSQIIIV